MQGVRKAWKESASLLLLSKKPGNVTGSKSKFNYDLLVMKRSTGSKFMANAIVFPGGVMEPADTKSRWLDLYSQLGVSDAKLASLRCPANTDLIYQKRSEDEQIERELSLRICAIRETFEEVGILIAKNKAQFDQDANSLYSSAVEGFDVGFWQKEVMSNPERFLDLCQTLEVIPDVFSLYAWANWMTPTTVGKHRFDTMFYVASLAERPQLVMDEKEAQHVLWTTPTDLLASNQAETIWLPPPQVYELSRLEQVEDFEEVTKFAKWRGQFGTYLQFPVQYLIKGKLMHVFPGDDLYPKQPNYHEKNADYEAYSEQTEEELVTRNMHRTLHESMAKSTLVMNIVPDREHLCPLGVNRSFRECRAKL